jgi:hypothetical protein
MTATAGASDRPDGTPLFRLAMLWGHYGPRWVPYLYSYLFVSIALRIWDVDPGWMTWPRRVLSLIFATALIGSMLCERVHDRNMCLRDLRSSEVLLDPQGAASKNDRALRFWHDSRRSRIATFLAAFALLASALAGRDLAVWAQVALTVLGGAGVGAAVWVLHVQKVHRQLKPWCPLCRHGGRGPRGDHDHTPTPDPVGTGNR